VKKAVSSRRTAERKPVLHYAVSLLSARPYSERKLTEKLRDRGYEVDEIAAAILRLKEKKLLDDRTFAIDFVHARCRSHPRGRTSLIQDLIGRGISSQIAQEVVTDLVADVDESELAHRLVESKISQYRGFDPEVRRRRLAGLLARRGFRPQTIFNLLKLADNPDAD
jgi:regulatory protein